MKVLITDGSYKHTLSIVRALGQKGVNVEVTALLRNAISFFSKFCHQRIVCPSLDNREDYIVFLKSILRKNKHDLLIPVGFKTTQLISKNKEELMKYVNLEVADFEKVKIALSKRKTSKLAQKVDVPYPKTFYPKFSEEIEKLSKFFEYPIVIKGLEEAGKNVVAYVRSRRELIVKYKKVCEENQLNESNLPMLQEYIKGGGYGFFALYQQGKCKRIFMHKRIREYLPSGGYSTCAESFYDLRLKEYGMRLLDALKWHGVAMVEFKKDERDGEYKLMEINPKFWGSLDLALAAGVNFPYYLCEMAMGKELNYSEEYNRNIRFHWPFSGDIQHIIKKPSSFPKFFVDCVNPKVKSNIWLEDLKPNVLEIGNLITSLIPNKVKKLLKLILRKA